MYLHSIGVHTQHSLWSNACVGIMARVRAGVVLIWSYHIYILLGEFVCSGQNSTSSKKK